MLHRAIPIILLALAAPNAAGGTDRPPAKIIGRVMIRERIIVRVPRMSLIPGRIAVPVPIAWREKKGPKCVNPAELGGAIFGQPGYVDLVLTGNRRLRARFDGDCGALDFYTGVYLRPGSDGMICADRDALRTRSGATCEIDSFKALVAKR